MSGTRISTPVYTQLLTVAAVVMAKAKQQQYIMYTSISTTTESVIPNIGFFWTICQKWKPLINFNCTNTRPPMKMVERKWTKFITRTALARIMSRFPFSLILSLPPHTNYRAVPWNRPRSYPRTWKYDTTDGVLFFEETTSKWYGLYYAVGIDPCWYDTNASGRRRLQPSA